ncbi:HlyD family secretion protein [Rhodobacterales bacterium]|nr:HlyD family secretion protein [Rhodobacterales bacterium]
MENSDRRTGDHSGDSDDADTTPDAATADQPSPMTEEAESENETGRTAKKPFWRRPVFLILLLALLAAIIAGGLYYWINIAPYESTDDAFVDADIIQVTSQISGQVIKVSVGNNVAVKKGDLLVEIDPAPTRAALETATAQLAQAEAEKQQAEASVAQAKQQAAEAKANLDAANVKADNAQQNYERNKRLFESNSAAISDMAVDDSQANALQVQAQAKASEQALATASTNVGVAEAKVAAATAAIKAAKAQVDANRIQLGYTSITASQAGTIVQNNVGVGAFATKATPLMALVPDDIFVTANFKETQLDRIRPGQDVDIYVDAYPETEFKGKVVSVQKGAGQAFQLLPPQNATGNFVKVVQRVPVRISMTNPDPDRYVLGPGMSVTPSIRVD